MISSEHQHTIIEGLIPLVYQRVYLIKYLLSMIEGLIPLVYQRVYLINDIFCASTHYNEGLTHLYQRVYLINDRVEHQHTIIEGLIPLVYQRVYLINDIFLHNN